jgi:hypothetical protein
MQLSIFAFFCPRFDANLLCFFAPASGLGKPLLCFAGSNISLVLQADRAWTKIDKSIHISTESATDPRKAYSFMGSSQAYDN